MPVKCVFRRTTGALKDKEAYYVEPTTYSFIDSEALMLYVKDNYQMQPGPVMGALYSVMEQMAVLLQNGHRVQVPYLGTFSIKMKGDVVRDGKGVLQMKNARYAGIQFTPDKWFTRVLYNTKFELVSHEASLVYTDLDEEQAMEMVRDLCSSQGEFLIQDFGRRASCSYSYARKVLNQLVAEGKLVKADRRYRLPEQQ